MKYFLTLFLILPTLIYSQTKKIDFESFLYGVNHCYYEYGNRDFQNNQVDIFFESPFKEEIIAEYLKETIKKDSVDYVEIKRIDKGPNFVNNKDDNLSQYYMFSESIKKGLCDNFDIQKVKSSTKKANSFIIRSLFKKWV